MTYETTWYGLTKSKKNSYTPTRGGMFKNSALKAELDRLEQQVPGDLRDLNLIHPDITVRFKSRSARRDRDGLLASVLDVLVRCKVLADDSIGKCNGRIIIEPAEVCDEDSVTITLVTPC
jgi:Holliday junction resolvase RusA-like endonuclease